MEIFANDLSIHEQFNNLESFRASLAQLMKMRNIAKRYEKEVYCHQAVLTSKPISGVTMQQAVGSLPSKDERRAVMIWLTHAGPFWDNPRQHGDDDWFECKEEIVTDTVLGEAAFRMMHGMDCGLVSFFPSDWNYSPVDVVWRSDSDKQNDRTITLSNWWDINSLEHSLQNVPLAIGTWNDLHLLSIDRFKNLTFAECCFEPLTGVPFSKSAAYRLISLLEILNQFVQEFDETGARTTEGQQLYQDYFAGKRALFSDSSITEKRKFREKLTFPHPGKSNSSLFCPWHGKVSRNFLRLHFSWPVRSAKPVYVVYVGPKITAK